MEKITRKHVGFEKTDAKFDDFCMFGQTVRGLKDFLLANVVYAFPDFHLSVVRVKVHFLSVRGPDASGQNPLRLQHTAPGKQREKQI